MLLTSPTLSRFYRLRRGNLELDINGALGDGMFIHTIAGSNRTYTNVNTKTWYRISP